MTRVEPGSSLFGKSLIDMTGSRDVPEGDGHLYSKQSNADAWIAVLGPEGMTDEKDSRTEGALIRRGALE